MTTPTEALLHELRNALIPLAFNLERGTATLEDCAQVTRRLLDFADEISREVRAPASPEEPPLPTGIETPRARPLWWREAFEPKHGTVARWNICGCADCVAAKAATVCGGALAYETMAGAFRVHKAGVYRFRCQKCGHEGANDGAPRTCDQPVAPERLLDTCAACKGSGGRDGTCSPCGGTGMVEDALAPAARGP